MKQEHDLKEIWSEPQLYILDFSRTLTGIETVEYEDDEYTANPDS